MAESAERLALRPALVIAAITRNPRLERERQLLADEGARCVRPSHGERSCCCAKVRRGAIRLSLLKSL